MLNKIFHRTRADMCSIPQHNKGFTLVELMIVVAIIGLLAMIALPSFSAYRDRSRVAAAVATCDSIRAAMAGYAASSRHNLYPVGRWADGSAGWRNLASFMNMNGAPLKEGMHDQGFLNFRYETIAFDDQDGADYIFVFQTLGQNISRNGSLIEVRSSGIFRWSGTL